MGRGSNGCCKQWWPERTHGYRIKHSYLARLSKSVLKIKGTDTPLIICFLCHPGLQTSVPQLKVWQLNTMPDWTAFSSKSAIISAFVRLIKVDFIWYTSNAYIKPLVSCLILPVTKQICVSFSRHCRTPPPKASSHDWSISFYPAPYVWGERQLRILTSTNL